MANDILKGLNLQHLEQLTSSGQISPQVFDRVRAQVVEPPMTPMSQEQLAATATESEVVPQIEAPKQEPAIQIPSMSNIKTPWLEPFSKDGIKKRATEAAAAGDLDTAEMLSRQLEEKENEEQAKLMAEQNRKLAQYEEEKQKAEAYNLRAERMGLPKMNAPDPKKYGLSALDLPATEQDVARASQPTVAEVEQEAAPIRQEAAQRTAIIREQDKQVANAIKKEEELKLKQKAVEDAERAKLELEQKEENPYGDTWGDRLRIALAVGLGSLGGGENPALKMIEAKQKKIAEDKKLNVEQKLAREKAALDMAKFELDKLDKITDSAYKRAQIEKMRAEIDAELYKKQTALQVQLRGSEGFSPEDLSNLNLDEKTRERLVAAKDAKGNLVYKLANNTNLANKLNEYMADVEPATNAIDRILSLSKDYSLVQKLNPLDPQRKAIETEMVALVGNLRLPFTGPGQLLEKEYERLRSALGNPNKVLTLPDAERAAMETVLNKLKEDTRTRYKQAGITLPMSREEKELAYLQKTNPDIPLTKLRELYNKRGN